MSGAHAGARGAVAALLYAPGLLYRAAVAARNSLYDAGWIRARRLPCPVISIGNLTVGGTGKTPLCSFIAGMLSDSGYRVGVLSRGYRRASERTPLLVSDGRSLLAEARSCGDEPYLIARDNPSVPVAVGADRAAAARILFEASAPEVVVLDDAFQHRRVARDIDLLLVDGRDPWGNGRMLPLGPLREPLASVSRADAVVVTRADGTGDAELAPVLERYGPRLEVFHARIEPRAFVRPDGESLSPSALKGLSAYAFSGIARPDRFEREIEGLGLRVVGTRRFRDHHRFRSGDLEQLRRAARRAGAEVLVTTEKDLVRMSGAPERGAALLYALSLGVHFTDRRALPAWLLDRLHRLREGRRRTFPER
ncbi:MAG: tetraacyldisaccharide 4'-kinase [Acidobacteriota bacterium]